MATNLAAELSVRPSGSTAQNNPANIEGDTGHFSSKACNNLYIALTGPIGAGVSAVRDQLKIVLKESGYKEVYLIKLSEHFQDLLNSLPPRVAGQRNIASTASEYFQKYRQKQEDGNYIREKLVDPAVFAHVAIREIKVSRSEYGESHAGQEIKAQGDSAVEEFASVEKIAFIIDQLKRPEEASLLRQVYKDQFFLCSVVETKASRIDNLMGQGASRIEAQSLMKIDKKENDTDWGQQVQKTVLESDYFHNNNNLNPLKIRERIHRFIELIHGHNGLPPTRQEFGMMQAHTASLGSLCLSRQVGAAILDAEGNLLSVGRNDVPKFGGGLYESVAGSEQRDNRCVHYENKECHNDSNKSQLKADITLEIEKIISDKVKVKQIVEVIESSKIKNLIEFSRSIHAEMDAIISLVRKGVKIGKGCILYTTTFPCHICARHIITAGIEKVVYIEPYEKSLAIDLHKDSLTTTNTIKDAVTGEPLQVEISSFHGVSPRKYQAFFQKKGSERKKDGKAIVTDFSKSVLPEKEYVVSFLVLENRCIQSLQQKTKSL